MTTTTSNDIKKYLKGLGHSTVRVRSMPGKGQWIQAWIPCDKGNPMVLKYSASPFSLDLRKSAVAAVYGKAVSDDFAAEGRGSYGNIEGYGISMQAHQWAQVLIGGGVQ